MKFKALLVFVGILILSKGGLTQNGSPQAVLVHVPIATQEANKKLSVEARVDGTSERVVFMRLYFKPDGAESFEYTEMSAGMSGYVGELAPSRFSAPTLDYFILALLSDKKVVTYPKFNPYGNPIVVAVTGSPAPAQQLEVPTPPLADPPRAEFVPELAQKDIRPIDQFDELSPVLVLSPEIGERFNAGEEVVIAVSFLADQDPIDLSSVIVSIDGLNVTQDVEITENLLTYSITNLQPGEHQAMVQGYFASGIPLPAAVWTFEVLGSSAKKRSVASSTFRGRVFAETRHEKFSGLGFSDNNMGGYLSGQYGFAKYDARVFVTTRESGQFQPRNRFSFDLQLGVLGMKIGDIYPRFNDLMLWGKRVRGIHGRLHLGFINFDIISGQTLRATPITVQEVLDPLTGLPVLDPLTGIAIQDTIPTGTFKQNLLGGRVSFGSGRNFQLGVNALKVRDDVNSLKPGASSSLPQDNLVAGADLLIGFDNRRFEIRGSVAASLHSTDITGGTLTKQEIEDQFDVDLPFDPANFSKYFIINASTTPLDPRDLTSIAYNFSLRLNYFNNNFQFGYKTLGSEYVSLGNTILRNNLQGFYFQDRMRLYKNKIYLNFGFENYDDNFKPKDSNPITKLQTLSYGLSLFPGGGFPNLTVSRREHFRDNNGTVSQDLSQSVPIITDTRENNKTNDLTVQLNYDANLLSVNHSVSLSFITSDRNDGLTRDPLAGIPSTATSSNVQVISVRTTYQIPLTTTFNFARNDNNFSAGLNTFNFKMFGARADYHLFNRKLQPYFGTNFTTAAGVAFLDATTQIANIRTATTDYKRTQFNLGARYEFTPGNSLFMDTSLISFSDNGGVFDTTTGAFTANPSFTDRIFRLYYEKRF